MKKIVLTLFLLCCLIAPAVAADAASTGDQVAVAATQTSVNINQAGIDGLQLLPGVGPALAERIVAYRDEHGPFQSVDQLVDVRGIGAKKLAKLRESVALK